MRPVDPRIETMAMAMWAERQFGPRVAWSTVASNWALWSDLVKRDCRRQARGIARLLDKAGLRQRPAK